MDSYNIINNKLPVQEMPKKEKQLSLTDVFKLNKKKLRKTKKKTK